MSEHSPSQNLAPKIIPQAPSELKSLMALNTAIKAARTGEANKQFINAALEVKKLANIK